jgi:transposase InsO family protein
MSGPVNAVVGLSVRCLCGCFGYTRQAYYQRLRHEEREAEQIARVLQLVRMHRCRQPYLGTRKLHRLINRHLVQAGEDVIGRDWLFELLRRRGFLVRRRRRGTRTTQSYHRFGRYRNLIRHMLFDGPGQAVVCDITYLRTQEGFAYLALATDLWSRKIVGWDLSKSLSVEGALRALEMAQKQLGRTAGVIHHSDQGIQYCCNAYVDSIQKAQMQLSMTEYDHAAENAVAERVNGILKNELNLDHEFSSVDQARKTTAEAVSIYNCERPHLSLDYETPQMRHAA